MERSLGQKLWNFAILFRILYAAPTRPIIVALDWRVFDSTGVFERRCFRQRSRDPFLFQRVFAWPVPSRIFVRI